MVAAISDDEKSSKDEGNVMAASWAASHHELARYMRENRTPKGHVRLDARARTISDLAPELEAEADRVGFDQDRFSSWLHHEAEEDLARMPYLGPHFEVIHQRLSNADDRFRRYGRREEGH
jgi:hypothetical protein